MTKEYGMSKLLIALATTVALVGPAAATDDWFMDMYNRVGSPFQLECVSADFTKNRKFTLEVRLQENKVVYLKDQTWDRIIQVGSSPGAEGPELFIRFGKRSRTSA